MITGKRFAGICGIATIPAFIIATPVGSFAFMAAMFATGLIDISRIPPMKAPYVWWIYAWYFGGDPRLTLILLATFGIPFVLVFLIAVVKLWRGRSRTTIRPQKNGETVEPERAESTIHGDARFLEPEEMAELFPPPTEHGFFPIGEIYRVDRDTTRKVKRYSSSNPDSWGMGGRASLLQFPLIRGDSAGGCIIGGSGSGKSAFFTIPALLNYHGSMVVNDPSGTVSAITARFREELGQRVVIIDPDRPELGAHNALAHIDITDKMASVAIRSFVSEACKPTKNDDSDQAKFFKPKAIAFGTAVLADMLYDTDLKPNKKTVREWRERLVIPQTAAKKTLERICAKTKSDYARQIASEMMQSWFETLGSILGQATADTEWLSMGPYADLLSEDTFDPRELRKGNMTVFTQFPTEQMQSDASVARVAIGSMCRATMRAKGNTNGSVPFIVDEMYGLKYMQIFEHVRDEGRKWNIPLFPMWQSEFQIDEVWGKSGTKGAKKAWFASASWRMYLRVDDPETAKEISDSAGTYTVIAQSEGDSTSHSAGSVGTGSSTLGKTQNLSLQPKKLLTPEQVRTNIRRDEALLFVPGEHVARIGIPLYFRRPEWQHLVDPDPSRQPAEEFELEDA